MDREKLDNLIEFCRAMNNLEGDDLSENEIEILAIILRRELTKS